MKDEMLQSLDKRYEDIEEYESSLLHPRLTPDIRTSFSNVQIQ